MTEEKSLGDIPAFLVRKNAEVDAIIAKESVDADEKIVDAPTLEQAVDLVRKINAEIDAHEIARGEELRRYKSKTEELEKRRSAAKKLLRSLAGKV